MPYCQMKTAPTPVAIERTEGVRLHLADGRQLIDSLASWWSACHGYNHPHIIDSIERQLQRMPHVMFGGVHHEPALTLASRLAAILPGDLNRVFFSDSGSVAVEVAMKMAIQFWRNQGQNKKKRFVAFRHAYHGDTTGAMSLCDPDRSMHSAFGSALLDQRHCDLPRDADAWSRFESLLTDHADELAGVFLEPLVQGAGGMRFHSTDVVRAIADACRRHEVLLIADELATGFGRTGSMFAIEAAEVVPDILCLGKALTAGTIGMAATIAREDVFAAFWSDEPETALMHGPTFMANPLACAAANASLDLFENEPRLSQVAAIENQLREELEACRDVPRVRDVRVKGAVGVIQVDRLDHLDRIRSEFVDEGVWLRPFGDCIYTTPPLVISSDDLSRVTHAMRQVTQKWSTW